MDRLQLILVSTISLLVINYIRSSEYSDNYDLYSGRNLSSLIKIIKFVEIDSMRYSYQTKYNREDV